MSSVFVGTYSAEKTICLFTKGFAMDTFTYEYPYVYPINNEDEETFAVCMRESDPSTFKIVESYKKWFYIHAEQAICDATIQRMLGYLSSQVAIQLPLWTETKISHIDAIAYQNRWDEEDRFIA